MNRAKLIRWRLIGFGAGLLTLLSAVWMGNLTLKTGTPGFAVLFVVLAILSAQCFQRTLSFCYDVYGTEKGGLRCRRPFQTERQFDGDVRAWPLYRWWGGADIVIADGRNRVILPLTLVSDMTIVPVIQGFLNANSANPDPSYPLTEHESAIPRLLFHFAFIPFAMLSAIASGGLLFPFVLLGTVILFGSIAWPPRIKIGPDWLVRSWVGTCRKIALNSSTRATFKRSLLTGAKLVLSDGRTQISIPQNMPGLSYLQQRLFGIVTLADDEKDPSAEIRIVVHKLPVIHGLLAIGIPSFLLVSMLVYGALDGYYGVAPPTMVIMATSAAVIFTVGLFALIHKIWTTTIVCSPGSVFVSDTFAQDLYSDRLEGLCVTYAGTSAERPMVTLTLSGGRMVTITQHQTDVPLVRIVPRLSTMFGVELEVKEESQESPVPLEAE